MTNPAATPSDLRSCLGYMRDFEMAYLSGQWSLIEPHFHEDAVHRIANGALPIGVGGKGRAAVVAGLRAGVEAIDRRFDIRIPEIVEGPVTRDDGVYMRFVLTLRRAGLPDLRIEGDHLARFRDGRIEALDESVPPGTAERVAAYLKEHDAALKPAGSDFAMPALAADMEALDAAAGRSIVRCYGQAKSERDIGAALAVCDEGFSIETVAFGLESRDREDTAFQLGGFFAAFPDYSVSLDGFATSPGIVTCWGSARLSLRGDFLGIKATNRTAELPIFCVFETSGGQLSSERFFFDLASLCEQIGVPVATMSETLATLRAASLAA